jgi:hypothetical protein
LLGGRFLRKLAKMPATWKAPRLKPAERDCRSMFIPENTTDKSDVADQRRHDNPANLNIPQRGRKRTRDVRFPAPRAGKPPFRFRPTEADPTQSP